MFPTPYTPCFMCYWRLKFSKVTINKSSPWHFLILARLICNRPMQQKASSSPTCLSLNCLMLLFKKVPITSSSKSTIFPTARFTWKPRNALKFQLYSSVECVRKKIWNVAVDIIEGDWSWWASNILFQFQHLGTPWLTHAFWVLHKFHSTHDMRFVIRRSTRNFSLTEENDWSTESKSVVSTRTEIFNHTPPRTLSLEDMLSHTDPPSY